MKKLARLIKRMSAKIEDNFLLIGIASLIWLLLRSGRKPSRRLYPCQRVAAANVGILLTLFPLVYLPRLIHFFKHKFDLKVLLKSCLVVFLTCQALIGADMLIKHYRIQKSWQRYYCKQKANQYSTISSASAQSAPLPRIVSVHSSQATSWSGSGNPHDYLNQAEINQMVKQGILSLTGETDYVQAWRELIPYQTGEAVAIKLNCNTGCNLSTYMNPWAELVNALIDGLTGMGVPADKIWLADPSRGFHPSWQEKITNKGVLFNPYNRQIVPAGSPYASVVNFNVEGPTSVRPGEVFCQAEHLINIPQLKGHGGASITLALKNHYGSAEIGSQGRSHWHDYIYTYRPAYGTNGINPINAINLNPQFKDKTRLIVGDGLYGHPRVNYDSPAVFASFDNNPPEILFFGTDPIAIDSVMFDYLQRECAVSGISARNDDILQEATGLGLGVFEHWNNDSDRQYSLIDYAEIDFDQPIIYGDVSGNGRVSATDAAMAARYAVGLIALTAEQITKADVTGNTFVSATDASWIARKAVDPTLIFPVEQ